MSSSAYSLGTPTPAPAKNSPSPTAFVAIATNPHLHTTNFLLAVVTPRNPHRVGGKPSAEIQENTESKKGLESSLTESRADLESKERLDSHFDTLDSNTESSSIESKDSQKQNLESSFSESKNLTESTMPKNLNKALPNINNSACVSTRPKRNCKIAPFLRSKNHIKYVARQRIPPLALVVCGKA